MKSIIISTFPGCGKTFFFKNQIEFGCSVMDLDSYVFKRYKNWENIYVEHILNSIGKVDFILITQQFNILDMLHFNNQQFVTVAPRNEKCMDSKERQLIKQQWFGRFYLRDNSHIENLDLWLKKLNRNYNTWTNADIIKTHYPFCHFMLNENEYLTDIIEKIYECFNY